MNAELLSPLSYFSGTARALHEKNVADFYDSLLSKSGVDLQKNAAAVKKYDERMREVGRLDKKLKGYKTLRVLLIIAAILGVILLFVGLLAEGIEGWLSLTLVLFGVAFAIFSPLVIFLKLNKLISHFDKRLEEERERARVLYSEALATVRPLLLLFTDYDTQRLIEKTLPDISFDDTFNFERLDDLSDSFGYSPTQSPDITVVDTLSGTLGTSPFLYESTKKMEMGLETYHGYRTISWTTVERDSKGRMRTVHHTDTLHASVTKPKPYYSKDTRLIFGHNAAPDLAFSRTPEHSDDLSEKALKKKINKGEDKLEDLERKALTDGDPETNFTKLANSEFEVLLGATNRTNEQQFRLLYTPLAQTETRKLLLDKENFGDDFSFEKRGRLNIIRSEHTSGMSLDSRTENYFSHDEKEIKRKFITYNNDYFKAVYFDIAPLLAIPAYHEPRTPSLEKYINMHNQNYPTAEYEVLANKLREPSLIPSGCDTEVIMKARAVNRYGDIDNAEIVSRGFRALPRTHVETVFGRDGRFHSVPIQWLEYIPVECSSFISVKRVGLSADEFSERAGANRPTGTVYHGLYATLAENMKEGSEALKALL